ncbi:hypothetical protein DSM101010T_13420 [Desulfovibrio subterraneus]|uniref:Uncharacterized protein n=1 Tax=Desulfovibrio subterraneus TaxID=2718620 RepID=A0A7J0BGV4_9BACT|nr:hypothetical protein DSM101010T_13420 [Desulfovibrio subterraneus]
MQQARFIGKVLHALQQFGQKILCFHVVLHVCSCLVNESRIHQTGSPAVHRVTLYGPPEAA